MPITFNPTTQEEITAYVGEDLPSVALPRPTGTTSVEMPVLPEGLTFRKVGQDYRLSGRPVYSREQTRFPMIARANNEIQLLDIPITIRDRIDRASTLHGSQFFVDRISDVMDNTGITDTTEPKDYRTFSTSNRFVLNLTGRITHIYIVGKGITGWREQSEDYREIPERIRNWEESYRKTTIYGFQHQLYELPTPINENSISLDFQGADKQIHAIMALDQQYFLNANSRYVEIAWRLVDRTGGHHQNQQGEVERYKTIGAIRHKWQTNYQVVFEDGFPDEFLWWLQENPNFAFAGEYSRYPNRVYRATSGMLEHSINYRSQVKEAGEVLEFSVWEQ